MTDEGKKLRYGEVGINSVCRKSELVCKSFLVVGIKNNLSGANKHMVHSETDTEMILGNEGDDEVFHCFTAQNITAATANANKSLME